MKLAQAKRFWKRISLLYLDGKSDLKGRGFFTEADMGMGFACGIAIWLQEVRLSEMEGRGSRQSNRTLKTSLN